MTLQEQQIEFFKWMGWTVFGESHGGFGGKTWGLSPSEGICELPKITLDLLHEAEKRLDDTNGGPDSMDCLRYVYSRWAYELTPKDEQPFRASKEVRTESLLRTVGMWKE